MTAENQPAPVRKGCAEDALRECDEARRHAQEGRWDEAVAAATRAIELDPDCLEAYQLRASLHLPQCDWPAVIHDLSEVLRLKPDQAEAYGSRAFAYTRTGQFERAVLDCNRAIERDSLGPGPYETRAYALHKLGRKPEAQADLRRSVLLRSTPEEIAERDRRERIASLLHRGDQFLKARQVEEAIQAFSAVLLECPNHVRARHRRGLAYRRARRFQEASHDLAEAWRLKRDRDRIARGYLVVVEGTRGEAPCAAFPDNGKGKYAAINLAEGLVKGPSPVDAVRDRLGGFELAKVYRFQGNSFQVIDWVWSEEHQARPATVLRIDATRRTPDGS
ncbi:MAG: tetratricopeptide repeat protein [Gemmataceae bacterium]|nr:tetratricopeptide repeat protein [Gemmataceae bacterium]